MATNCVDECNQSCIGATWLASNKSVSRHTGRSPFVFVPEIDTPFGEVIDRQFQPNPVASENTDAVFAHAARCVRRNDRAVFQGNAKPAVREHLIHDAVQFRQFFLCQSISPINVTRRNHSGVRISGPRQGAVSVQISKTPMRGGRVPTRHAGRTSSGR